MLKKIFLYHSFFSQIVAGGTQTVDLSIDNQSRSLNSLRSSSDCDTVPFGGADESHTDHNSNLEMSMSSEEVSAAVEMKSCCDKCCFLKFWKCWKFWLCFGFTVISVGGFYFLLIFFLWPQFLSFLNEKIDSFHLQSQIDLFKTDLLFDFHNVLMEQSEALIDSISIDFSNILEEKLEQFSRELLKGFSEILTNLTCE